MALAAQVTSLNWKDHVVNVVDTPGHADFGSEVQRILQVGPPESGVGACLKPKLP